MNDLSLMLYLADVVPSVGSLLSGTALAAAIGIVGGNGVRLLCTGISNDVHNRSAPYTLIPRSGVVIITALVFAVLGSLIPSTKTLYMIAASEAGEAVITNPEAQQIFDALKARIKDELAIPVEKDAKGKD